jgi:hypothetical protein
MSVDLSFSADKGRPDRAVLTVEFFLKWGKMGGRFADHLTLTGDHLEIY